MIALSYSRLSDYRQCPMKFYLKYIDKAPNFIEDASKSPHLVRGGNVHKGLENYVIKKRAGEVDIRVSTLKEVEDTKPLIDKLMTMYDIHPEYQVAINDKFELVDWFAKDAWFRVIMDVLGFGPDLLIGDYKTGKLADYTGSMNNPGQLHLSSLIGMAVWPQFNEVRNYYFYVDHKQNRSLHLTRDHYEPLKQKLQEEHAQVNSETAWTPCKNQYCNFCQASIEQCQFSKKSIPGSGARPVPSPVIAI